jgi:AbrB family looped-hinge helix DNA binding protein
METTTLSSRGQVVIPKLLREARHWLPGTEFGVEDLPQGILLRPLRAFAPSRLEDVLGCVQYQGPALSQDDIDAALQADAEAQYRPKIGPQNPTGK